MNLHREVCLLDVVVFEKEIRTFADDAATCHSGEVARTLLPPCRYVIRVEHVAVTNSDMMTVGRNIYERNVLPRRRPDVKGTDTHARKDPSTGCGENHILQFWRVTALRLNCHISARKMTGDCWGAVKTVAQVDHITGGECFSGGKDGFKRAPRGT